MRKDIEDTTIVFLFA